MALEELAENLGKATESAAKATGTLKDVAPPAEGLSRSPSLKKDSKEPQSTSKEKEQEQPGQEQQQQENPFLSLLKQFLKLLGVDLDGEGQGAGQGIGGASRGTSMSRGGATASGDLGHDKEPKIVFGGGYVSATHKEMTTVDGKVISSTTQQAGKDFSDPSQLRSATEEACRGAGMPKDVTERHVKQSEAALKKAAEALGKEAHSGGMTGGESANHSGTFSPPAGASTSAGHSAAASTGGGRGS